MKKTLLLLAVPLLFSCESEGTLTRNEIGSETVAPESVLLYSGSFVPTAGIHATGSATIYKTGSDYIVSLQDFSLSAGPDLKVYLSKSAVPDDFINLGALGNGSTQAYAIPKNVDVATYDHVLIHCQQYNHLYAIAPLKIH